VREREFRSTEALHEVEVEYIDNWTYPATDFVIWEVKQEHGAEVVSSLAMPHIDDARLELDQPELLQAFLGSGTNKQDVVDSEGRSVFKKRSLHW
jgi:hypothetical protein